MIIGDATKRRQDRLDLEKRRKQKSLKSGSALPSPPEDFLDDDHHLESEEVDDDLDSDDDSNDDEDDSDDELTHWVIPQVKRLNKGNTHRRREEHPHIQQIPIFDVFHGQLKPRMNSSFLIRFRNAAGACSPQRVIFVLFLAGTMFLS